MKASSAPEAEDIPFEVVRAAELALDRKAEEVLKIVLFPNQRPS